jgi:hypothetical protein
MIGAMRRLARYALRFLTALSLLLFIAMAALGATSTPRSWDVIRWTPTLYFDAQVVNGWTAIYLQTGEGPSTFDAAPQGWACRRDLATGGDPRLPWMSPPDWSLEWRGAGVWRTDRTGLYQPVRVVLWSAGVPCWVLCVAFGILPSITLIRSLRRRKHQGHGFPMSASAET